jgi:hypothetical protein
VDAVFEKVKSVLEKRDRESARAIHTPD